MTPLVSVVILNWNGKDFLRECLISFRVVRKPSHEIIVVDNASTDDSVEMVKKKFPWVRIIARKTNEGFAGGNNIGWRAARGRYVLFLNNDTVVTPNFLSPLVATLDQDPAIGCVQPEMRVMKNKLLLDTAGSYLTPTGFLYHFGYRKPFRLLQYRKSRYIFSAKGACMLIPKLVLQKIGGFDEDFFIFFEETDLCHRIWLAGYSVVYDPASFIYHVAGGDTGETFDRARRIYLTFRNMNYSYLKNFGLYHLLTIYPVFVLSQVCLLFFFACTGKFSLVSAMVRAYWWLIIHSGTMLSKRRFIQSSIRAVSDYRVGIFGMYHPRLYYYYCLLFHAEKYTDERIPHAELT